MHTSRTIVATGNTVTMVIERVEGEGLEAVVTYSTAEPDGSVIIGELSYNQAIPGVHYPNIVSTPVNFGSSEVSLVPSPYWVSKHGNETPSLVPSPYWVSKHGNETLSLSPVHSGCPNMGMRPQVLSPVHSGCPNMGMRPQVCPQSILGVQTWE